MIRNSLKMLVKVILCFMITEQLIIGQTQSAPNFCDTQHFDGIWNFGPKLQTIWRQSPEQRWLWTYNSSAKILRDPPDLEPKQWTTLSALYISSIPECSDDPRDCERSNRAKNMVFVREAKIQGKSSAYEITTLYRVNDNDNKFKVIFHQLGTDLINKSDIPWYLTYVTLNEMWPWSDEITINKLEPRASVFWPQRFQVYFIDKRLFTKELYNYWQNISDVEWYQKLSKVKLSVDDVDEVVGMFHLDGQVFAIGHNSTDQVTKVFQVEHDQDQPVLTPQNKTIRQFFGCVETTPKPSTTTSITFVPNIANKLKPKPNTDPLHKRTNDKASPKMFAAVDHNSKRESKKDDSDSNMSPVLVTIVVIIVVVITVVFLIFVIAFFRPLQARESVKSTDSRDSMGSIESTKTRSSKPVIVKSQSQPSEKPRSPRSRKN